MRPHEIIASLYMYQVPAGIWPDCQNRKQTVCHAVEGMTYQDRIYFNEQGRTVAIYISSKGLLDKTERKYSFPINIPSVC